MSAALLVSAALSVGPAHAEKTADQFARECRSLPTTTPNVSDLAYCVGYLNGFNAANAMRAALGQSRLFCPPKTGIHDERLRRVFLAWIDSHPMERRKSARSGVLSAFEGAFPCKP
jgi:hypothetical protein